MELTARLKAFGRTSIVLVSVILLAELAACSGMAKRSDIDAALPPVWPAEVTMNSCEDFASVAVGSYVIASNYWNKATCPGTQCMEVNTMTGAFCVTQGPPPCGNEVASYPNVLYGCSYGNCSPGTMLPLPVPEVKKVYSDWSFDVGGGRDDRWNMSYDIWFCPDDNCGASGFPKGLELMIWLDYRNAQGWRDHLGEVNIAGYKWDVWVADMAAGGALESWVYLDYIVKGDMLTNVSNFDLGAFIRDAKTRGYVKDSMYMYAIQAGMEVRSGGIPFTSNNFSVSINGVTPSNVAQPDFGPSCDGGLPVVEGLLSVNDSYVTTGALHGYGAAWAWKGPESEATTCISPTCTGDRKTGAISCTPALPPSALCATGAITADPTYASVAGVGFNLNQEYIVGGAPAPAVDGGAAGSSTDGGAVSLPAAITIPNTITLSITKNGTMTGNSSLRAQLTDENGVDYCYGGSMAKPIPITKFNTACWNNTGDFATPTTPFTRLDVIVPSSASTEQDFSYCLTDVVVE